MIEKDVADVKDVTDAGSTRVRVSSCPTSDGNRKKTETTKVVVVVVVVVGAFQGYFFLAPIARGDGIFRSCPTSTTTTTSSPLRSRGTKSPRLLEQVFC